MLSNKKQIGFTVVETLIVIAVTGMMFMSTSLLIRGKVARTSYQDSMRQLQQMVQNTINDVENGYMSSNSGNSDTLVIGKKFWFCADDYPWSILGCGGSNNNGNVLYTATINQSMTGPNDLFFTDEQKIVLPGGIKFKYFTDVNGVARLEEFGSRVMLSDYMNRVGRDAQGVTTAKLYHRHGIGSAGPPAQLAEFAPTNNLLSPKYILCFQGYRNGSLEIGSSVGQESGSNVVLNIEDPRCK